MPNWEVFKGRGAPVVKDPYVTLQKGGSIALSKPACDLLGGPGAVELLFDRETRMMGVRPASTDERHAYPIRHTPTNPGQYLISGVAFFKFYDLDTAVSRRYTAHLEDGVLCVDLNQPAMEIVGNRSRHAPNGAESRAENGVGQAETPDGLPQEPSSVAAGEG
jgi:hypothetical protein